MKLADRLSVIKPSATMAISAQVKAMRAEGIDIVGFGAGEPDFDTPDFVKQAAIEALNAGKTKYTDAAGMPQLRDALVEYYKKTENLDYERAETIFSLGGKHSIFNAFQAILSAGDEVIIPTPYWVSYPDQVALCGGQPRFLNTSEEDGFLFSASELEQMVTKKTKAIVINSPSNPSGAVYNEETLRGICDVAARHKIYVIWDEIYKDIYYGEGRLRSLPCYNREVKPYTIIISGLSKSFSMTGWRIGWALGPKDVIKGMSTIQGQSTSNPVTFAQYGALAAIERGPGHLSEWKKEFQARRDTVLSMLGDIPGVTCLKPMGAFYVFPNFSCWFGKKWSGGVIENSTDVAKFLLERGSVAVVPGSPFGAPENVRISYALSMEEIEKGMGRIKIAAGELE